MKPQSPAGTRLVVPGAGDEEFLSIKSTMRTMKYSPPLVAAALGCVFGCLNADSVLGAASTNAPGYYRLGQVDEAIARAKKENKPIAWIASFAGSMAPHKNPLSSSSHAATYYAYLALYRDAIIVWSDSGTENHREPPIIDRELHSPDPHYTAPGVIVLTPDLERVIGKVFHIADSQARQAAFADLLHKIRDKKAWSGQRAGAP